MTPPKPVRCHAIVNAKGRIEFVWKGKIEISALLFGQRRIKGRFVPDAPKGRKGRNADRS